MIKNDLQPLVEKFKGQGILTILYTGLIKDQASVIPFFLCFLVLIWFSIKRLYLFGIEYDKLPFTAGFIFLFICTGYLAIKFLKRSLFRIKLFKANLEKPDLEISETGIKVSTALFIPSNDCKQIIEKEAFFIITKEEIASIVLRRGYSNSIGGRPADYFITLKNGKKYFVYRSPFYKHESEIIEKIRTKLQIPIELEEMTS